MIYIGKDSGEQVVCELTTDEIKEARKIYAKDVIQVFRDGQISKEYIEAYPEKVGTMLREGNITAGEVNKAQNVWDDLNYYNKE